MTVDRAAELLGIRPQTVRNQITLGRLRAVKFGRDWRISTAEVARYRAESLGRPGRPAKP